MPAKAEKSCGILILTTRDESPTDVRVMSTRMRFFRLLPYQRAHNFEVQRKVYGVLASWDSK